MACAARIDIEPDDVAQFVDEARVVGQLELAHPVRLQTMGAPDALDELTLSPAAFDIRTPVQWVVSPGGSASVSATTRSAASTPSGLMRGRTRLVAEQPIEALLDKALPPAPNTGLGLASSPHNLIRADTIGGQQHDLRPPDVFLRRIAVLNQGFEPTTNIGRRNGERFSSAHRADSHDAPAVGIPLGIQMSGSIH